MDGSIERFIKTRRDQGATDDIIRAELKAVGWNPDDISRVLSAASEKPIEQVPQAQTSSLPRFKVSSQHPRKSLLFWTGVGCLALLVGIGIAWYFNMKVLESIVPTTALNTAARSSSGSTVNDSDALLDASGNIGTAMERFGSISCNQLITPSDLRSIFPMATFENPQLSYSDTGLTQSIICTYPYTVSVDTAGRWNAPGQSVSLSLTTIPVLPSVLMTTSKNYLIQKGPDITPMPEIQYPTYVHSQPLNAGGTLRNTVEVQLALLGPIITPEQKETGSGYESSPDSIPSLEPNKQILRIVNRNLDTVAPSL